jgi:hypothetical protein
MSVLATVQQLLTVILLLLCVGIASALSPRDVNDQRIEKDFIALACHQANARVPALSSLTSTAYGPIQPMASTSWSSSDAAGDDTRGLSSTPIEGHPANILLLQAQSTCDSYFQPFLLS